MKKKIITILVILAAAAGAAAVIIPRMTRKEVFAAAVADPVVEVTNPEVRDLSLTSGLVGTIEPEDVVHVYPKAGGEITAVKLKAGDTVKAGQLIAEIDTKQTDSAKSSLDSASLALSQAQEELSRQAVLYAGGGLSEQAYKQYQDAVKSAQISYSNAKTTYDNQVSYTKVTAPISGLVESADLSVFDQVTTGTDLCVISGQGARVVSFYATERIKNSQMVGDEITVEKDGERYAGVITEISSMTDSSTGLFEIKARMDAAIDDSKLPTGSTVKLTVISESASQVLTVPVNSVYYESDSSFVYTYDPTTGSLHKVEVEVGLSDADYTEITSGLNASDQVLTTWSSELYEGTKVRLKGEAEQAVSQEAETGTDPLTDDKTGTTDPSAAQTTAQQ